MSNSWDNKKVLVVEPSGKYLQSHVEDLESIGLEVVGTANNGVECLKRVEELQPDLVTLDIVMEAMDGIECAKILAKEYPKTQFMFITRMTQDKMLNEALKTNFSSWLFMSKPLDINQLQFRLDKIFENQSSPKTQTPRPPAEKDPRLQTADLDAPQKQSLKAS